MPVTPTPYLWHATTVTSVPVHKRTPVTEYRLARATATTTPPTAIAADTNPSRPLLAELPSRQYYPAKPPRAAVPWSVSRDTLRLGYRHRRYALSAWAAYFFYRRSLLLLLLIRYYRSSVAVIEI